MQLDESRAHLEKLTKQLHSINEEKTTMSDTTRTFEERINVLASEVTNVQSRLERATQERDEHASIVQQLRTENEQLRDMVRTAEVSSTSAAELSAERDTLLGQMRAAEQRNADAVQQLRALLHDKQAECEKLQALVSALVIFVQYFNYQYFNNQIGSAAG